LFDRCFGLLDAQNLIDGVELGDHLAARHLRAQVYHKLLDAAGDLQGDRRLFFGEQPHRLAGTLSGIVVTITRSTFHFSGPG
jgi:hypothetical protein